MPRCDEADHEEGSLILALMLTITLLALGSLMTGVLLAQARTTRHDQTFTGVLPAADASIARGLFMLNNGLAAALPSQAAPGALALGGQTADWYASPVAHPGAPTSYQFSATTRGLARRLSAEAYQSSRFSVAAFSNKGLTMRGGNSAGSYNSANGTRNATGRGVVGSNGSVTLNGNATADGVQLWNWGTDPDPKRCSGSACSNYSTVDTAYDITSPAATQFISNKLAGCGTPTAFVTSTSAPSSHALPSGTWCASSLNLDVDTVVTGPTVIYVAGNVTIGHHLNINYSNSATPLPANLQIYMLGSTYDMANHTNIAASIYAPLATCNGGAQSGVYGSLVCDTISSVGGWQFHYDEALGSIGGGDFRIRNYREG